MSNWFDQERLEDFKRNQGENLPPGGRRFQEVDWLGQWLGTWDKAGWRFLLFLFLAAFILSSFSYCLARWWTNQVITFSDIVLRGLIGAVVLTLLYCAAIFVRFLLRKWKMRVKRI